MRQYVLEKLFQESSDPSVGENDEYRQINFYQFHFWKATSMHVYINGDNWLLWILSTIRSKTKIISSRRVAYCRHCSTAFPPERNSAAPGQQHHEPWCWPLRQHTIFSPPIPPSLPGLCELLKIPETKWEYWEPVAACKYALVWRDGGSVH